MVEAIDVGKKRKEFLDPLPGQAIKQHQKLQKVLQDAKSKKHLGNLYEHIVDVINHIVKCCPDKAIERFEEISYLLKNKDTLAIEEFLKLEVSSRHCRHDPKRVPVTSQLIEQHRAFFVSL